MSIRSIVVAAMVLASTVGSTWSDPQGGAPAKRVDILAAEADLDAGTLLILGDDFAGGKAPSVALLGVNVTLRVLEYGPHRILAELPRDIPAASYVLLVVTGRNSWQYDEFDVTIGAVGPQGEQGPAGPQGAVGPKGDTGVPGPTGPRGPVGPTGPQGQVGPQGARGDMGPMGPMGPVGPEGAMGSTGPLGPQGHRGEKGDKGDTGVPGQVGLDGMPGPMGPMGPIGPQGEPGAPGVIRSFTSAWFPCGANGVYTVKHALGSTKLIVQVQFCVDGSAAAPVEIASDAITASMTGCGAIVTDITPSNLTVRAGRQQPQSAKSAFGGALASSTVGFYRVLALALE